jgi:bifunctional non-homologous end joining protein LigD
MPAAQQVKVDNRTLKLTNPEKVLYPAADFTKAQVLDYYARVAEWLVPHFRNRPVTLRRFPDGVGGQTFYEKDAPRYTPGWISTTMTPRRAGGKDIRYIMINDRATLLWCANLASLELHPFLHRGGSLETPSCVVFDLDPGEGASIADCAQVALLLRDAMTGLGLQMFPKMSGSKGIQAYVPLNRKATYETTQPFAHALADRMARQYPDRIVSNMNKSLRKGKVFIDWSQNSDFKTTVGVYSLRAKERPSVSMPVTWEELASHPERLHFEPAAALERLEKTGDLFAPLLKLKQSLPKSAF